MSKPYFIAPCYVRHSGRLAACISVAALTPEFQTALRQAGWSDGGWPGAGYQAMGPDGRWYPAFPNLFEGDAERALRRMQ